MVDCEFSDIMTKLRNMVFFSSSENIEGTDGKASGCRIIALLVNIMGVKLNYYF